MPTVYDTLSVFVILALLVGGLWVRRVIARRRRAANELAARKAAQLVAPIDMRTLWLDDARRNRIAVAVMEQVSKHHDYPEYKH